MTTPAPPHCCALPPDADIDSRHRVLVCPDCSALWTASFCKRRDGRTVTAWTQRPRGTYVAEVTDGGTTVTLTG